MLESQRKQRELSQVRSQISEELAKEEEERSTETLSNLDAAAERLNVEFRAALQVEQENKVPDVIESVEGREILEIRKRSSIAGFALMMEGSQDGAAEKELRSALLGDRAGAESIPLSMLLTPLEFEEFYSGQVERRAVTPVAAAAKSEGNQQSIAARVFDRSVAARLGIPMPSVGIGEVGYPVLTSGTTFSNQAPSGDQAAVAGSFGGVTLLPIRATGSYEFRKEDMATLVGLEEALRADLRNGLADHLDDQVLNGNGTAPNVQGIRSAVSATPSTDPGNADDFSEIQVRFLSLVDGKYATSPSELQLVMSPDTYSHTISQYRGTNSEVSAFAKLREEVGGIMISDRMPDAASDISLTVVYKSAYPERSAQMPVWLNSELVVDPYSLATKGEIRITMITLFNFRVLASDAFAVRKIHD